MKQKHIPEFELYILLAISQQKGESYGAEIRREIEERSGRSVAVGAIYETLARLERKRFVRSFESEPLPVQGGRSRRYFSITAAGSQALATAMGMLGRMAEGLELL